MVRVSAVRWIVARPCSRIRSAQVPPTSAIEQPDWITNCTASAFYYALDFRRDRGAMIVFSSHQATSRKRILQWLDSLEADTAFLRDHLKFSLLLLDQ